MKRNSFTFYPKMKFGIATVFFACLVFISLIPLSIIGVMEYNQGKKNILSSYSKNLSTINFLLGQKLDRHFQSAIQNLSMHTKIAKFFLEKTIELEGSEELQGQYIDNFQGVKDTYGYSDILLIDVQGNIRFVITENNDLGQNVFLNPKYNATSFAQGVRESIAKQELIYVDVANYPTHRDPVSFFIHPILNDKDNIVGVLAIQITSISTQDVFLQEDQNNSDVQSYLVGVDRLVHFGNQILPNRMLQKKVYNPLINFWLTRINGDTVHTEKKLNHLYNYDNDFFSHQSNIQQYINSSNKLVLGDFYPIKVANKSMTLISEMSQEKLLFLIKQFRNRLLFFAFLATIVVILIAFVITHRLIAPIKLITSWVKKIASGDYNDVEIISGNSDISQLSKDFSEMTSNLKRVTADNQRKGWIQEGQVGLNKSIRGEQELEELCKNIVSYLATYLKMQTGAMYVVMEDGYLQLMGSYAWSSRKQYQTRFEFGEGMVGQAAIEKESIILSDVPKEYMAIESGLGVTTPSSIIVIPFIYEGVVKGVFEFGVINTLSKKQRNFLDQSVEIIAISINSAQYRTRVNQLLLKTTSQSKAMKQQQKELKVVNDKLEHRAKRLENSQKRLEQKSQELQFSNKKMEDKTKLLEQQKQEIQQKNKDIELSRQVLEGKAQELELASKYKSEFLANMSHELRTPLNSLLLLSQMLANNDEGNLTQDQIESMKVIYSGGKELLDLINDILDLSKIEAGKMMVDLEKLEINSIIYSIKTLFNPVAKNTGLELKLDINNDVPAIIFSDEQRLMQVLKNFLSNSFKFTKKGSVTVCIDRFQQKTAYGDFNYIQFSVVDTGIGISQEKQDAIFEAFQQADGSTSRQYGGTGLGLAISKEIVSMLGGFIEVKSTLGQGSTFSVYLPLDLVCILDINDTKKLEVANDLVSEQSNLQSEKIITKPLSNQIVESQVDSKANTIDANSLAGYEVLLVDDDLRNIFALSKHLQALGLDILLANNGQSALDKLSENKNISLILMDIMMPVMDGYETMEKIRIQDKFKDVPIIALTANAMPEDQDKCLNAGANDYLAKPIEIDILTDKLKKWLIS